MHAVRLFARQMAREHLGAGLRRRERPAVLQFGEHECRAAARDPRRVMAGLDIVGGEAAGLGDDLRRHRLAERERLRRRKARPGDGAAVAHHLHRHEAREFLEHHRLRADRPAVTRAFPRQREGGADIGMAGERHLRPRREDAHLRGVRRVLRRQHEGGLGEIELAGDRLHLRRGQSAPVEHHGKRIAAERPVGEHVDGHEIQSHGGTRKELPSPSPI